MADPTPAPLKVFISFASEDDALREEMVKHFAQLERDGLIESWHGRQIGAGEDWAGQIDAQLEAADIVLLLVSPAFLHSRYCYDVEMRRALERHAAGQARVIPVILRPADWQTAPFAKLQAFPSYAKPVVSWASRDEALLDVARGLRRTVGEMRARPSSEAGPAAVEAAADEPIARPGPVFAAPAQKVPVATPSSTQEPAPKVGWKRRQAVMLIVVPTLLLGIAGIALTSWRVPTRAAFDLVVDRVVFTAAGARPVGFPRDPLGFRTLTIEEFDRAKIGSTVVEAVQDEPSELLITAATKGPTSAGRMESIALEPGAKVVLEARRALGPTLTVRVYGQTLLSRVLPQVPLAVQVKGAAETGDRAARPSAQQLVLRATVATPTAPLVEVQGDRRWFAITVTAQTDDEVLLTEGLPIGEVEFLQEGTGDSVKSSVLEAGRGTYVEHAARDPITLGPGDFLGVGDLRDASLARLTLLGEGALQVRLEGVFGKLDIRASGVKRDRRLTAFDRVWYGSRPLALLALVAWAVLVLTGAAMLVRGAFQHR